MPRSPHLKSYLSHTPPSSLLLLMQLLKETGHNAVTLLTAKHFEGAWGNKIIRLWRVPCTAYHPLSQHYQRHFFCQPAHSFSLQTLTDPTTLLIAWPQTKHVNRCKMVISCCIRSCNKTQTWKAANQCSTKSNNPYKTNIKLNYILAFSSHHTVNTLRLTYNNQSVKAM